MYILFALATYDFVKSLIIGLANNYLKKKQKKIDDKNWEEGISTFEERIEELRKRKEELKKETTSSE